MEYTKTAEKIMKYLMKIRGEIGAGQLITDARVGRNAGFEAIEELKESGFLFVKLFGRQKIISLNYGDTLLNYKIYKDSLAYSKLSLEKKIILKSLVIFLSKIKEIKAIEVFGSFLESEKYNDIDILLLGNIKDNEKINYVRKNIQKFFNTEINFHFDDYNIESVFRGRVIYNSSSIKVYSKQESEYADFLEWIFSYQEIGDKKFLKNSYRSLAFV